MVTTNAPTERYFRMQLYSVPLRALRFLPVLYSAAFSPRGLVALLKRTWLARLPILATALIAYSSPAKASPSVLAVRTKGAVQEKALAVQAVTEAVTGSGWTITPRAFTAQELEELAKCFPADHPWPCIAQATRDAAIGRLVLLSLEAQPTADGAPMTVVTVQVASGDQQDAAHGGRRYCQPCSPDRLGKLTAEASKEALGWMQLKSGKTFLEVKSRPVGAIVSVDGKRLGVTDAAFPIMPGPHRVVVSHPKYPAETRVVEVRENRTLVVTVVFGPNTATGGLVDPARAGEFRDGVPMQAEVAKATNADHTTVARQSLILPTVLLSAGAVVIAGGALALVVDEDDAGNPPEPQEPQRETFRNTAPLGVGMLIGGALVAGAGGWLLWSDSSPKSTSRVSAGLLRGGGAAVSIVRAF